MSDTVHLPSTLEARWRSATPLQWSGPFLPKDGDRVRVNLGDLGPGRVLSFFAKGGALGVVVRLDQPSELLPSRADRRVVHVYGAEIEPEDSP